jgi:hypothetical protein
LPIGRPHPTALALIAGHATVGRWTLGAICDHLVRTINLTLDSPPANAPATREQVLNRRLFFRAPAFPEGQTPPLPDLTPTPDADLIASSASLRTALARLAAHDGPFPAHPPQSSRARENR